jgi:hypothetical protein
MSVVVGWLDRQPIGIRVSDTTRRHKSPDIAFRGELLRFQEITFQIIGCINPVQWRQERYMNFLNSKQNTQNALWSSTASVYRVFELPRLLSFERPSTTSP